MHQIYGIKEQLQGAYFYAGFPFKARPMSRVGICMRLKIEIMNVVHLRIDYIMHERIVLQFQSQNMIAQIHLGSQDKKFSHRPTLYENAAKAQYCYFNYLIWLFKFVQLALCKHCFLDCIINPLLKHRIKRCSITIRAFLILENITAYLKLLLLQQVTSNQVFSF